MLLLDTLRYPPQRLLAQTLCLCAEIGSGMWGLSRLALKGKSKGN